VAAAVAGQVGGPGEPAGGGQGGELLAPRPGALREAVEQEDERAILGTIREAAEAQAVGGERELSHASRRVRMKWTAASRAASSAPSSWCPAPGKTTSRPRGSSATFSVMTPIGDSSSASPLSTSTGQAMRGKCAVRSSARPASGKPKSTRPANVTPGSAAARLAARPPNEWPPATTSGPARAAKTGAAR